MTAQVRRAVAEVDPNVPLEQVQTMAAALAVHLEGPKALGPALRAMRINPTIAMRAD